MYATLDRAQLDFSRAHQRTRHQPAAYLNLGSVGLDDCPQRPRKVAGQREPVHMSGELAYEVVCRLYI